MKLILSTITLAIATTDFVSGHCWPCTGEGEYTTDKPGQSFIRITKLGKCVNCCNWIVRNGFAPMNQEPFSDEVFSHRDHCKEIHCQDWETETGASCDAQGYVATGGTLNGQTIMRPFCPSEHRCGCSGNTGPTGCVGGEVGWEDGPGLEYGCRNGACNVPTTW